MQKPGLFNYGNYSNDNYGVRTLAFKDGFGHTFYFSYETLVAFTYNGELYIRENEWGPTTGKHLNWIDPDKSKRISGEKFNRLYDVFFNMEINEPQEGLLEGMKIAKVKGEEYSEKGIVASSTIEDTTIFWVNDAYCPEWNRWIYLEHIINFINASLDKEAVRTEEDVRNLCHFTSSLGGNEDGTK